MDFERTPQNFLLYLRSRSPDLARLLDGVRSIGRARERIEVRAPSEGWPGEEIFGRSEELSRAAKEFWGESAVLELVPVPFDPERLPFPVTSSKVWNHAAFFSLGEKTSAVAVIRKPALEKLLREESLGFEEAGGLIWRDLPPGEGVFVPSLLDRLLPLMRKELSYVHLVTEFRGHGEAGKLESGLYAAKEWGTPLSPAPILQKYIGRAHFADGENPSLGLRLAKTLAGGELQVRR